MIRLKTLLTETSISADNPDYSLRVGMGKSREAMVLNKLTKMGYKTEPSNSTEDIRDGIDGWIVDEDGRHSVQIKVREGGDDIIFELIKDISRKLPGRDMHSKSDYYLMVGRGGEGKLFRTEDIKAKATELFNMVMKEIDTNTLRREYSSNRWEVKATYDRATGNPKIMAFMNPRLFEVLVKFNFGSLSS